LTLLRYSGTERRECEQDDTGEGKDAVGYGHGWT
jgi:hypothetical protein